MGLFTKIELKKEYFESTKGYSRWEIKNLRERQGFDVEIKNSNDGFYVEATRNGFPKKILISDFLGINEERLGGITIYGFKHEDVISFLNQNFGKSGNFWRTNNTELVGIETFQHDISRCTIHYPQGLKK